MAAISLRLPDELKGRIKSLAEQSGKSAHAFMVEAIAREAKRAEAQVQVLRAGKTYDAAIAFAWIKARGRGEKARRPRLKAWRRPG